MLRLPRAIAVIGAAALVSIAATSRPFDASARDILRELIETDTTHATGSTTRAADAIAARLKAAGFPDADVQVLGPDARHGNLVARLRGTGAKRPLLLLAHLDVVDARRADWSVDPFRLLERDGHFYGRGTSDDKAMASILTANLIRLRQEHTVPDRDLILALTADEEGGDHNGVKWLLASHRDLIDAAIAINEGGSGEMKNGRNVVNEIQASEKAYQDFGIEARGAGGHSAKPGRDNAIAEIAAALTRVAAYEFPLQLSDVTRAYFGKMSALQSDAQLAADMRAASAASPDMAALERLAEASPSYNAMLRTTCVPTRVRGGFANNALPQAAAATINCRILPGEPPDRVRTALVDAIDDRGVSVSFVDPPSASAPSPLTPEILQPVEQATRSMWPEVAVVPVMGVGASDGVYLRNAGIPTYGVEGLFRDVDDDRAHGRDERIGVKQYYDALEFQYRLIKALSSRPSGAPVPSGR